MRPQVISFILLLLGLATLALGLFEQQFIFFKPLVSFNESSTAGIPLRP